MVVKKKAGASPNRPSLPLTPSATTIAPTTAVRTPTLLPVRAAANEPTLNNHNQDKTQTYNYSKEVKDTPYGWTAAYTVQDTPSAYKVTIRTKIKPASDVKANEVKKVKDQTSLEFARYWDARFQLKDAKGNSKPINAELKFVSEKAHLKVNLHAGEGRDNLKEWYVKGAPQDRAHELGHQLGMKDEYLDETAPSRDETTDPGVKTDHSLMGNYYEEGEGQADVKLRHGEVLAGAIAGLTGKTLTALLSSTYRVRSGDSLKSLALRFYGDDTKTDQLYNLNTNIIPKDKKITPGMILRIK